VHEADTGIELGIAREPFLHSRHAYQHQADRVSVEEITYLLKAGDAQPIGFVHEDQADRCQQRPAGRWRRNRLWLRGRGWRSHPVDHQQFLEALLILGALLGCERRILGAVVGLTAERADRRAEPPRTVDDFRCVENGVRRGLRL
jgi:hypothetical protein